MALEEKKKALQQQMEKLKSNIEFVGRLMSTNSAPIQPAQTQYDVAISTANLQHPELLGGLQRNLQLHSSHEASYIPPGQSIAVSSQPQLFTPPYALQQGQLAQLTDMSRMVVAQRHMHHISAAHIPLTSLLSQPHPGSMLMALTQPSSLDLASTSWAGVTASQTYTPLPQAPQLPLPYSSSDHVAQQVEHAPSSIDTSTTTLATQQLDALFAPAMTKLPLSALATVTSAATLPRQVRTKARVTANAPINLDRSRTAPLSFPSAIVSTGSRPPALATLSKLGSDAVRTSLSANLHQASGTRLRLASVSSTKYSSNPDVTNPITIRIPLSVGRTVAVPVMTSQPLVNPPQLDTARQPQAAPPPDTARQPQAAPPPDTALARRGSTRSRRAVDEAESGESHDNVDNGDSSDGTPVAKQARRSAHRGNGKTSTYQWLDPSSDRTGATVPACLFCSGQGSFRASSWHAKLVHDYLSHGAVMYREHEQDDGSYGCHVCGLECGLRFPSHHAILKHLNQHLFSTTVALPAKGIDASKVKPESGLELVQG